MYTRHLVDPQLVGVLDAFDGLNLSMDALPKLRSGFAEMQEAQDAAPGVRSGLLTEEHFVPGEVGDPQVRVVVTRPAEPSGTEPLPALLWIHGGGYIMGNGGLSHPVADSLVRELGVVAVSVDYRLAPETPHPGPVHDCYTALRWMHEQAGRLGTDRERIAVAGESAGGGLAAALALLARDRAEFRLCAQLLIYPMLDDRTAVESDPNPSTGEFIWTRSDNAFGWRCLLGHEPGRDGVSSHAAAARAEDVGGLPPAFIAVGSLDLFLDEDIAYAHRLMRAGVPTELHVHPGAFHGYLAFQESVVGSRLRHDLGDALRRAIRPAGGGE